MNTTKISIAIGLSALLALAPVADAQRINAGPFQGTWKGTLTMDTIIDVLPEDLERLGKTVELELRITARAQVEIYFTSPEDEWEFQGARGFILTRVGEQNGVIDARMQGNLGWFSAITLNMAVQSEDALLLSWGRLTTRDRFLYDGLDEYGFAGVAILNRAE